MKWQNSEVQMTVERLYKSFFTEGTRGHYLIRTFYSKYADLLSNASLLGPNDVTHEVFASIAKTDFGKIRDIEHYVMRAIKIQCWSLLDKAIRRKKVIPQSRLPNRSEEVATEIDRHQHDVDDRDPVSELEGLELLNHINLFKLQINSREVQILNFLINETSRTHIAEVMNLNLNTLDTYIRRLRIKLVTHLRNLGYEYSRWQRFDGQR
jgi:DNA-directed RNA polymerase specialized sigma24 family protein